MRDYYSLAKIFRYSVGIQIHRESQLPRLELRNKHARRSDADSLWLINNNKGGKMQRLKRQTFSDELHKLVGSKIFSAKFTKKDGSDRVINCMLGVKKHLRGGERTTSKEDFMIVFDTIKKQYRNVNLKTLDWIRFNGKMYKVKLQYRDNQLKLMEAENLTDD